jgi:4a-hydroxytetrahydrobiopterin dehydratase
VTHLARERCVACRRDAPTVEDAELAELSAHVPDWAVVEVDGVRQLRREFSFGDFAGAMRFAQAVADIAEQEAHHPALLVEWGKTTVTWWTHKIHGLHRNDFVMAAKTDELWAQVLHSVTPKA